MLCDRIPIVSVRPGERSLLNKNASEEDRVLTRLGHRSGLFTDERKIACTDSGIGKFNFQLVVTEEANANNLYHHSGPAITAGDTTSSIAAAVERGRRSLPCLPKSITPAGASPARWHGIEMEQASRKLAIDGLRSTSMLIRR